MSLETPQLWSKLNKASDITSPQRGVGGAVHGSPVFEASYYGNAIHCNASNANYLTFPAVANNINMNKGAIEFWSIRKITADGQFCFWSIGDATNCIYLQIYKLGVTGPRFEVHVVVGGAEIINMVVGTGDTYPESAFGRECPFTHIGVAWDREGNDIGGGKTIALITDNLERVSDNTTWGEVAPSGNLFVLNRWALDRYAAGTIDNLKTFNVCKTDFNDRGIEFRLTGSNHNFLGADAFASVGPEMKNKIWWFPYVCPEDGYPIKMVAAVRGPIDPFAGVCACALYDENRDFICSSYGRAYSQPSRWLEFVFLPPGNLTKLEAGKTYYFAAWGEVDNSALCREDPADPCTLQWRPYDFGDNWPNWPTNLGAGVDHLSNKLAWYVVLNTEYDDPDVPAAPPPDNLLCEQKTNPTDVADPKPEFSAIFHGG